MYTVVTEYELDGRLIQETLERIEADNDQDARDVAYSRIKNSNPNAKSIDILAVYEDGKVA
jgi:hypothetical protein